MKKAFGEVLCELELQGIPIILFMIYAGLLLLFCTWGISLHLSYLASTLMPSTVNLPIQQYFGFYLIGHVLSPLQISVVDYILENQEGDDIEFISAPIDDQFVYRFGMHK